MDSNDRKSPEEIVHCFNWIHLSSIGSIGRTKYQVRGCTAVDFKGFFNGYFAINAHVYIFIDIDMDFIDSTRVNDMLSLANLYIASDSGSQFISFLSSQTFTLCSLPTYCHLQRARVHTCKRKCWRHALHYSLVTKYTIIQ